MMKCPLCCGVGAVPDNRPSNVIPFPRKPTLPEYSDAALWAQFLEVCGEFLRPGDLIEFDPDTGLPTNLGRPA